jgi:ankyrin repeat protein
MPHAGDLWMAIWKGNIEQTRELLKCDSNFARYRNPHAHYRTPLHLAAECGNIIIANLLLEYQADVNAQDDYFGETPLHNAAYLGHLDLVNLLIEHGADVTALDPRGKTPFFMSTDPACKHPMEVQAALIKAGAGSAITLFDLVRIGNLSELKKLIQKDRTLIGSRDTGYRNSTPLHHAVETNQYEIAEFLLSKKADVNAVDAWGWKPLDLALEFDCSPKLIELLKAYYGQESTDVGYPFSDKASKQWPGSWPAK